MTAPWVSWDFRDFTDRPTRGERGMTRRHPETQRAWEGRDRVDFTGLKTGSCHIFANLLLPASRARFQRSDPTRRSTDSQHLQPT